MKRCLLIFFLLISFQVHPDTVVPREYSDAVTLQEGRAFNKNAVLAFVYSTYFMFDKHVPVEEFLKNLVGKGLNMKFPEAELKSHDDFRKWYNGIAGNIKSNTHTVESVVASMNDGGTYGVHVIVFWQALTQQGEYLKFRADQKWTLIEDGGSLKIRDYLVSEAK